MSDPQRQHPVAALVKTLDVIRNNIITILFIVFIGGGSQADIILYWISGTIFCLLVWGIISWFRFTYRVEEGELSVEQGVLIRKKLHLTYDRIQVIDISAGIVERLFGLVAVEVKTAGSTSKMAKISALTREKAEELKSLLRKSPMEEHTGEVEEGRREVRSVYALNTKDLLIAATTSGQLGVTLTLVAAAFSQIEQFISGDQIIRFIEANLPRSASVTLILLSIIAVILISWLLSFLSTLIKYYDFSVEVRDDELLISRGLFERTQLTIPFNRIQAVQIKEELLRQPFGYASLVIESAGYVEKKGISTTLFPLIAREKIYGFIDEVIPEYHPADTENTGAEIPKRGLRRYLLRMFWRILPVIILGWMVIPYDIWFWFLLIPALLLGYQQYRDAAVSHNDDTIILCSRLLSKTTGIIKKYRVQAAQIQQNPFQSRLDLSNLTVYVASGNQGRSFTVRELAEQKAREYWEWLSNDDTSSSRAVQDAASPEEAKDRPEE